MKKSCCLVALVALLLTACHKAPTGTWWRMSYMWCYWSDVSKVWVQVKDGTSFRFLECSFRGDCIMSDSEGYAEIGELYGDTDFRRQATPGPRGFSPEWLAVEVVSDQEFNGRPAGTSLADVTMFVGRSASDFVAAGYPSYEDFHPVVDEVAAEWWAALSLDDVCSSLSWETTPVAIPLSEFGQEDWRLLTDDPFCIVFTEEPAVRQHTFTVTFRFTDGESVSESVECDFDGAGTPSES